MTAKQISASNMMNAGTAFAFIAYDSAVAKTVNGSVFDFAFDFHFVF